MPKARRVATAQNRPTAGEIAAALTEFTGDIEQVPPAYSAIKISGERAYDLARSGEDVALEPRIVTVERFDLIATPDADHAEFEIRCGKGTYIRSIARDLGIRLGCYGHVSALRRTATGPFGENDMVPLDAIREAVEAGGAETADEWLRPVEAVLSDLTPVVLRGQEAGKVLRGQAVLLRGAKAPIARARLCHRRRPIAGGR